jgi:hypothetical protein
MNDSIVKYLGYATYAWCVFMTIMWIIGIRTYTLQGRPPTKQTVHTTMLFVVSVVLVPMLSWSPLHLLWMFPVSFILGLLSHGFPLSLLMLPGRVFFGLACIGLDREQARKNHVRLEADRCRDQRKSNS